MGLMDVTAFLVNSTKCDTWSEIKASHKGPSINDVYTRGTKKMYSMTKKNSKNLLLT